jgi:squalene-associated FAD-dependent desaturase
MGDGVAIVGAGYAGMAAAVTLAERGIPVTVFEAGWVPGGRARRVVSQGHALDNGQHILIGAYTELFALMRKVGVPSDALLRVPLELRYPGRFSLRALWFPAPLGLVAGFLLAKGASFSERAGALAFLHRMRRAGFRIAEDLSVEALLEREGQTGALGRYLWRPLCVSALNTPAREASAQRFLSVLRDALCGGAEASDLLLPRVDLSRLFPEPAADFIRAHGGEIRYGSAVRTVSELDSYNKIILAVGPHQLKNVAPELAHGLAYQPIYTCYLQYPESVRLDFPMLGLADGLVQWVFDRGRLIGEKGRLACVISAQGDHQQMTLDALAERCDRELGDMLPGLPAPLWSRVIAEKRATIACAVGLRKISQTTPMQGVYLAGDYTDPEYPPTLEAAVRSGVRAATSVAAALSR